MKLEIKGTEVEIKGKMRAYLIYEQLTNKAFNPKTFTEMMLYFYSLILANAKDIHLTFEEFMDYLDENEDKLSDFYKWLAKENDMNNQLTDIKKKKANR